MATVDKARTRHSVPEAPSAKQVHVRDSGPQNKLSAFFGRGGAALQHRNFRYFWFGQLVSLVGTWMQNVGQSLLVYSLTGSVLALGTISTVQFMPVVFFSLIGGVIADRWPKRTLLIITQTISMILAFILAILVITKNIELWHIYVLAALLGTTNAFDTPTRQAFVSEMVAADDLPNAIALNSAIFNTARFIGPVVAGVLIDLTGYGTAFLCNAISFVAVIVGLVLIRPKDLFSVPPRPKTSAIKNLKEGLAYIVHTPTIYAIILLVLIVGTFGLNLNVWAPALAKGVLQLGDSGYGWLMGAFGLGSLGAALGVAFSGKKPSLQRIFIATVLFAIFLTGVGLSSSYFLTLVFMVGAGASAIFALVSANTTVQMLAPAHLRGRVMSVYFLVFAGTVPLGSPFAGITGSAWGIPASMVAGAILSALAVPIILLVLHGKIPRSADIAAVETSAAL